MFRPVIVAIFKELFFEVYITQNVEPLYKCEMISFK
jgi:hypothetical protein